MATEWEKDKRKEKYSRELDGGTQEIEQRGQKFMVRVFGLGGMQMGRTDWADSLDDAKIKADKQIGK